MRFRIYFCISILLIVALTVAAIFRPTLAVILSLGGALLLAVSISYLAVSKPLEAVQNGFSLLRSQDFSSRLRKTGQYDADRIIGLYNLLMDTMKSERLRLMELNGFLAKLMEVSPIGIAICDLENRIIERNAVFDRICNPAIEEVLASMQPDESQVVRMATSQIYRCSRLWFMDSGFRRTFYLIEVLTDEIIDSERNMFKTIVRTIGHEVGNTLAPVSSVLNSLAEIHSDDRLVSEAINATRTSCENLADFVRSYAGVVKLPEARRLPVDLGSELKDLMPVLRSFIPENVELELSLSPKRSTLNLDMMLIERAIINIVKNAAESIGTRQGKIILSLDGTRLTVTDTGPGIDEEAAGKLFTPFFSTKRPDRGVGLMLISHILRSHGAEFSLITDPVTSLTTFTIDFSR